MPLILWFVYVTLTFTMANGERGQLNFISAPLYDSYKICMDHINADLSTVLDDVTQDPDAHLLPSDTGEGTYEAVCTQED